MENDEEATGVTPEWWSKPEPGQLDPSSPGYRLRKLIFNTIHELFLFDKDSGSVSLDLIDKVTEKVVTEATPFIVKEEFNRAEAKLDKLIGRIQIEQWSNEEARKGVLTGLRLYKYSNVYRNSAEASAAARWSVERTTND